MVLGEGPDAAALRAKVDAWDLVGRVHFAGYREDILEHYAAADVFVRAMILEGDNMSSLLAMAMRLPVVAFDTGAADAALDPQPKRYRREGGAAFREEDIGGRARFDQLGTARVKVALHGSRGFAAQRHIVKGLTVGAVKGGGRR